ncbi:hypothetical protein vseg_013486 [Gypsophila vaccaria]
MTQFRFPNTITTKTEHSTKELCPLSYTNRTNITLFCSYLFSQTLYFSYLVFFFPYIFKLVSFLSPLFFTTFLLFLSLVTTLVPLRSFMNSNDGFLKTSYYSIIEHFRPSFDDDVENEENAVIIGGFEVYKVVFDVPEIELKSESNPVEEIKFGENPDEEKCQLAGKTVSECGILSVEQETVDAKPEVMEGNGEKNEDEIVKRSEVKVIEVKKTPKFGSLEVKKDEKLMEAFQQTHGVQQNLGSFGSMRKEKEWRRTLACKLFEERHNWSNNNIKSYNNLNNNNNNNLNNINSNLYSGNDEEVMDLLWENCEVETNKGKVKQEEKNLKRERKKDNKNKNNNNKNNININVNNNNNNDNTIRPEHRTSFKPSYNSDDKIVELMRKESSELSEEYDDYDNGKVCCLQALKLSAGKMNLSMGSPNLAKISKVFKGIGWLQTHAKRKGKKGNK